MFEDITVTGIKDLTFISRYQSVYVDKDSPFVLSYKI